jgi:hypothetical protein
MKRGTDNEARNSQRCKKVFTEKGKEGRWEGRNKTYPLQMYTSSENVQKEQSGKTFMDSND